jgi:6-phosphofructokinase 1
MMTINRASDAPYTSYICHSPVAAIANQVRRVPDEFINESANNVTDACCRYLAPLIEGEATPDYIGGLPAFYTFD